MTRTAVPADTNDPVCGKEIGFYLFSLPAYVVLKNWLLLTLVAGALFAGAVYWLHGDVDFSQQRPSISPMAVAHGSALLIRQPGPPSPGRRNVVDWIGGD